MALGIKRISVFTVTLSAVVVYIGFYAWRVMFNNFAVEVFDASPADVGLIQAAREIPGLLAFGAGALALYFTESKIAAISGATGSRLLAPGPWLSAAGRFLQFIHVKIFMLSIKLSACY